MLCPAPVCDLSGFVFPFVAETCDGGCDLFRLEDRTVSPGQDLGRLLMPNQAVVCFELRKEGSWSSSSLPALPVHHRGRELESIRKGTSWTLLSSGAGEPTQSAESPCNYHVFPLESAVGQEPTNGPLILFS